MNLVIDIGNSRAKVALFSSRKMIACFFYDELTVVELYGLMKKHPEINNAIFSSVAAADPSLVEWLKQSCSFFLTLDYRTPMPIHNNYLTPQTLGLDRLAAAIGAQELFPARDLLVIDAGTAVTLDLVERNGTFAGGNISPGLTSRFRALHEFTRNLPLLKEEEDIPLIGRSTEEAIKAGVIYGMTLEIDGMIDLLKKKYNELQPVLTGGDAPFFERRLKNPIFVKSEITLIGLNRILEYNVEKQ